MVCAPRKAVLIVAASIGQRCRSACKDTDDMKTITMSILAEVAWSVVCGVPIIVQHLISRVPQKEP